MKVSQNWLCVLGGFAALAVAGCGPSEPGTAGAPVEMHRLTEDQYRNIIADIFGSNISLAGRFDPIPRTEGLLAVGASNVSVTPSGFARYEDLARSIAAQVVSEKNRNVLMPCKPAVSGEPDDACAKQFYSKVGKLIYRRPLLAEELQGKVDVAHAATKTYGDFYQGLASGLAAMLAGPDFLYVADFSEPDPGHPGARRLDAYSKASRLSFLLWNTTPDDELLAAAESGALNTEGGLEHVVDAMLASPRLESGVRAFVSDMFGFDAFDTLEKDGVIYPAFSLAVAADAKEQTLRTVADHLVAQRGDYRDLFTTRKTFMSRSLGVLFNIAILNPDKWVPYEFPDGDAHVGIQTQPSFVALYSHPGTSSPTLRGRALRERLLCQKVPDPPAAVSFELFNDPNSVLKTKRERLKMHSTNPACAGCHKITDPIGVALENFDGAGQFRTTENGVTIDISGEIDGQAFKGPEGLGKQLHDNPAITSCVVNRVYAYATGRAPANSDRELITYFEKRFASDGYKLPDLLRNVVTSEAFFAISSSSASPAKSAAVAGREGEGKS